MSLLGDGASNPASGEPVTALTLTQAAERIASKSAPQPEPRERPTAQAEDDDQADVQTDGGEPDEGEAPADGEEASAEAEGEEDADETASDDLDLTRKVKVKVGGKEVEIPLSEALAGYQREADYRQKTQAAAEERRAADEAKRVATEHAAAVQAERQHLAQIANAYKTQLLGTIPTEAQLAHLKQTNPTQFLVTMEEIRGKVARVQAIDAEVGQALARTEQEAKAARDRAAQEGLQAISEAIPEFKDPAKRQAVQAELRSALQRAGYADAEIAQIVDPRIVKFVHQAERDRKDAEAYRKLQQRSAQTEQRVADAPRVARPGTAVSRTAVAEGRMRDLQKRADRTGRIEDVAAVIAARSARK